MGRGCPIWLTIKQIGRPVKIRDCGLGWPGYVCVICLTARAVDNHLLPKWMGVRLPWRWSGFKSGCGQRLLFDRSPGVLGGDGGTSLELIEMRRDACDGSSGDGRCVVRNSELGSAWPGLKGPTLFRGSKDSSASSSVVGRTTSLVISSSTSGSWARRWGGVTKLVVRLGRGCPKRAGDRARSDVL